MNYDEQSLKLHRSHRGKWEMRSRFPLTDKNDLSIAYTPGVAAVSSRIAEEKSEARELTMKGNSVAIISDGSAVLGLGDIGPEAALPVMEGKAILFKEFAGIDGVPLVIDTNSPAEIIDFVRKVAPTFGGINLEDIRAPECFEVEDALQDLGIPVFHDDQHGTAIVLFAALLNSLKITGKKLEDLSVVINGSGAAGTAIARMLGDPAATDTNFLAAREIILCDSKGIISPDRGDLNEAKRALLPFTNQRGVSGTVLDALKDADVFIGVSKGNLLGTAAIQSMAPAPIIFALANPIPEIMPELARSAGAAVVGTGRSDFPNQVNNVLAFPGIFRGALDAGADRISPAMKRTAALALAECIANPTPEKILPDPLDRSVAPRIAEAVKECALSEMAKA